VNPETRTMRTEVDVDNAKLTLVPGMYADATLALDQARDALTAPVQAVDRTEDGASVFVVKDGRLERRPIVVGLEAPDRVEVRSGLAERELVVVGSRSQLKPGEPVNARIEAPARAEKP
jgi:membrane fusion protein, multidrug efflux system